MEGCPHEAQSADWQSMPRWQGAEQVGGRARRPNRAETCPIGCPFNQPPHPLRRAGHWPTKGLRARPCGCRHGRLQRRWRWWRGQAHPTRGPATPQAGRRCRHPLSCSLQGMSARQAGHALGRGREGVRCSWAWHSQQQRSQPLAGWAHGGGRRRPWPPQTSRESRAAAACGTACWQEAKHRA